MLRLVVLLVRQSRSQPCNRVRLVVFCLFCEGFVLLSILFLPKNRTAGVGTSKLEFLHPGEESAQKQLKWHQSRSMFYIVACEWLAALVGILWEGRNLLHNRGP